MEPVVRYSLGKTPDGLSAVAPDKQLISVLFISDLLLMRAALCRLLEGSEIGLVGEVASCEEALSLTAAEHPHIVLVDLDSRADSLACVRDLASSAEGSRIIVLTDRARTADIPTLMELGAAGVVLKHERPEVLIKAIRKCTLARYGSTESIQHKSLFARPDAGVPKISRRPRSLR